MAYSSSSSSKRPFPFADASFDGEKPQQRKVRFPKKKKVKLSSEAPVAGGDDEGDVPEGFGASAAASAAKERAKRRRQITEDSLGVGIAPGDCEIRYEDDANVDNEDGVELEPFNLDQEREEGYFDEHGNYVEYVREREVKDAWLDNVQVDTKLAKKQQHQVDAEEDYKDLTSDDIGRIKRRIADILQPGETIIEALKRLKGSNSDKRGKMSEGTKLIFDELTEAAMTLMENGEYNVYHDDRETFEREAEGFEKLARARQGTLEPVSGSGGGENRKEDIGILSDVWDEGTGSRISMDAGPSSVNAADPASNVDDSNFDMFGDDDDADGKPDSAPLPVAGQAPENANSSGNTDGGLSSDYVYDPSSGYYYSSSLGYYYDPTTGYYCFASTGTCGYRWYSYDEQSGDYKEVQTPTALAPAEQQMPET